MWSQKGSVEKKEGTNGLVAVAIDKDKGSQNALKWAIDHLIHKGQTIILIHVKVKTPPLASSQTLSAPRANHISGDECPLICKNPDAQTKDVFLPFRVFCTRKDVQCKDIILEESDVAKALNEYISHTGIEHLVIGSSSKNGLLKRFKLADIPGSVSKGAPDFCTIYVINKGKIQSMRSASRPAPSISPLRNQLVSQSTTRSDPDVRMLPPSNKVNERLSYEAPRRSQEEIDSIRSPFTRRGMNIKSFGEISVPESDISYVSSGRPSVDRIFPSLYSDNMDMSMSNASRPSFGSDLDASPCSFESMNFGRRSVDILSSQDFSTFSQESDRLSTSSQAMDEVEAEMRRLRLELKQTMEMYSNACKEALNAKQKAIELQRWKMEEERRMEETRNAGEAALAIVEKEKAKSRAAMEAAEAHKRLAELEAQKRINAEMKAFREAEEKKRALDALANTDVRYRRYSIEEIESATEFFASSRKIGEGGYGPVYKCHLDHTPVAVKILRPDAAQGRSQFQQEVEVLSCIRHPNMVLLLGACPEYGCLVYEYMANGSLDDCLFRRGNAPPLSWQIRFKIAAEIGTGLLFLHQTKPEPLVHRDLKPANILLDRNYVAKISDVGLARLVPPSIAENVTQYRMTSTAGTFCYIDPEYQQTGMLGVKSDIYSLGIMLLQIITAKPPMGLTHHVERSIEKGTFSQTLDPAVTDWPVEEAMGFAKMALQCAELRRKDRPDLGKVVLPELNRLRVLAEDSMYHNDCFSMCSARSSPANSQVSLQLEATDPSLPHSE